MSDTISDKFVRLLLVAEEAKLAIDKLPSDDRSKSMLDMAHGEAMNAAHAGLGSAIAVLYRLHRIAEVHAESGNEADRG